MKPMPTKQKYPSAELSTGSVNSLPALSVRWRREGFLDCLSRTSLQMPISQYPSLHWTAGYAPTFRILHLHRREGQRCTANFLWWPAWDCCGWSCLRTTPTRWSALPHFLELLRRRPLVDALQELRTTTCTLWASVRKFRRSRTAVSLSIVDTLIDDWCLIGSVERQLAGDLKGLLASVDFTVHGSPDRPAISYAPAGGAQPKSSGANSQFTNCIVTVVWSDGVNRTPPVSFHLQRQIQAWPRRRKGVGPGEGKVPGRSRAL